MPTILTSNTGVRYNVEIEENVTTTTLNTEQNFPIAMRQAFQQLGEEIKKKVAEEYLNRRRGYSNQDTTKMWKGNKPALEETGNLKKSVTERTDDDVEVKQVGTQYSLKVQWKLPTAEGTGLRPELRKNNTYVYLWSHEFGTSKPITHILAVNHDKGFRLIPSLPWIIPQRDFFLDGIQKGIDSGSKKAGARIAAATDMEAISKRSEYIIHKPIPLGIMPSIFPKTGIGWMWYIVPPSQYYATIGMAYDIAGLLKGSFFSFGMAGGYARQMAVGKMGVSKKVIRRKVRGRIWYGD